MSNVADRIAKLRVMTVKNGATQAEERTAAEKIGRLIMENDVRFESVAKPRASGFRAQDPRRFYSVNREFYETLWQSIKTQQEQDERIRRGRK